MSVTTFAKKVMELPPIYNDSEAIMVIGSLKDHAVLDVFSKDLLPEKIEDADINRILHNLSISLMTLVDSEIKNNKIVKTQPLISLCKFLAHQYPELVLDDDTYYMRKSVMRSQEAINENPTAHVIRDAFMEVDVPEHNKTFQIQITSVSREDDYLDRDKVQIFTYDE